MKVLLVNPPRSPCNEIWDFAPPLARPFVHRKLVGPPLGLLTLACALRPHHDVRLLELKGEMDLEPQGPEPMARLRSALDEFAPDVVATTAIASETPACLDILRLAKSRCPEVVTVVGGLQPTLRSSDFDDSSVDAVVKGHGAPVLLDLVRAVEAGAPLSSVEGLLTRTEGALRWTRPSTRVVDAADRDFFVPDRSLVDRVKSTYTVGPYGPATYVFSSLGCHHRCSFCSIWPACDGQVSLRRIDSLVEELAGLDDYPVVRFADANSAPDPEYLGRLADAIASSGVRKDFIMDLRADTASAHPRLIERLARCGLKVVICGFESFRNDELKRYRKSAQASAIEAAVGVFHECGILVRGNYVVPPDYLADDFEALAAHASAFPVNLAGYTILTPMPGTPFHDELESRIVDKDLAKYNFFCCVLETVLPREEFLARVGGLWAIRRGDFAV
ncbi:MAG: cobalamin-dependent protein [Myxococcota bacterium]|jgi:radical SAM superfamily enzyme YgiQ (UPF0313 family)|nr:cobalamin-dependent protein [Myxococcota bacterium]